MTEWLAAQTLQFEFLRRLAEIIERQHPKAIPCHECGKLIPVKYITIRDNKVLCEKCYEKLYVLQGTSRK